MDALPGTPGVSKKAPSSTKLAHVWCAKVELKLKKI